MTDQPKIFKAKWDKTSCKSCGGGDDDKRWKVLLLMVGITLPGWIIWSADRLAAQGARVTRSSCAWDPSSREYVASAAIRNDEDAFKVVSLRVQGHFRPPKGQTWPHPRIRDQYEAVSKERVLMLEPKQEADEAVRFSVPGTEDFLCTAKVWVDRQERFSKRPPPEVVAAVSERR